MMGNSCIFKYIPLCLLALVVLLANACQDDEDLIFDDSLKILSQKIDTESVANGVDGIGRTPSIELIFTHSLKTAEVTSALSFTGSGGAIAFDAAYSNTNSTLTLTPSSPLDYETSYTLSLPMGNYGDAGNMLNESFSLTFTYSPTHTHTPTVSSCLR